MEFLNVLVNNYKTTTEGLNIFIKIFVALVFALIAFTVVSAFLNVILYGV